MNTRASTIVYLNTKNKSERKALHKILVPHSWATGEFGLMITNVAFEECIKQLSCRTSKSVRTFLRNALADVNKNEAGDVCLNFGVTG